MAKRTNSKSIRPKRSSDPNVAAHSIVSKFAASTETGVEPSAADISRVMAALGRKGGKIGGKARMTTMTQEQRSQIAFKAAQARWKKKQRKPKPKPPSASPAP